MRRHRPTSVTVLGYLLVVFGCLWVLCSVFSLAFHAGSGGSLLAGDWVTGSGGRQLVDVAGIFKLYAQKLPAHARTVSWTTHGLELTLSLLMVVSGIGLLGMRPWGRELALLYGLLSIVLKIFGTVYALLYTLPVWREVVKLSLSQAQWGSSNPRDLAVLQQAERILNGMMYGTVVVPLVYAIFPIVVLVYLFKPALAAAFHRENDSLPATDLLDRYRDLPREEPDAAQP